MKRSKILALILSLAMLSSLCLGALALNFSDVKSGDSYYGAVSYLYDAGVVKGSSGTSFDPSRTLTRAECATFLGRTVNASVSHAAPAGFDDVAADGWSAGYIAWAVENGLMEGTNGKFNPKVAMTVADINKAFDKFAQVYGIQSATAVGSTRGDAAIALTTLHKNYVAKHVLENNEGRIVTANINGASGYFFVPSGYYNRYVTAPIVLVYGDKAQTLDSAMKLIVDNGIAAYAQAEEATVFVFNPVGSAWGEADMAAYAAVVGNYTDSSDTLFVNGISPEGKYSGANANPGRVYVVASGAGADFASQYLSNNNQSMMTPWGFPQSIPVTGFVLFDAKTAGSVKSENTPMPAALYNCADAVAAHFKAINSEDDLIVTATGSMSKDSVTAGLTLVSGYYRYSPGATLTQLFEVPDYKALGITETVETRKISTGDIEFSLYIPDTADLKSEGTVPVLLLFHGGGNCAEFVTWSTAYPEIGYDDGLVVVAVNHHVARQAGEIMELADILYKEYPSFDTTRLYASGFSMGSQKTQDVAAQFGDRVAAVAPHSGSFGFGKGVTSVPFFYIGGEESPLPELPHQTGEANQIDTMIQDLSVMNGFAYTGFDKNAGNKFGIKGDEQKAVKSADGLHTMTQVILNDKDGVPMSVLASTTAMTHATLPFNAAESWAFMREFSRK